MSIKICLIYNSLIFNKYLHKTKSKKKCFKKIDIYDWPDKANYQQFNFKVLGIKRVKRDFIFLNIYTFNF